MKSQPGGTLRLISSYGGSDDHLLAPGMPDDGGVYLQSPHLVEYAGTSRVHLSAGGRGYLPRVELPEKGTDHFKLPASLDKETLTDRNITLRRRA